MEKNIFSLGGKLYSIENGKLFDIAFGHYAVEPTAYIYIIRSNRRNILAFKDKVFFHDLKTFTEAETFEICHSDKTLYTRTVANNPLDCCVFYQSIATGKIGYMGSRYEEVLENEIIKIGKAAYQINDGELIYLQKCEHYEFWRDRLEIHTGEKDFSELFVYQKKCGSWTEVHHKIPMTQAI